jgi:serine/threonine protein kinase
LLYDGKTKVDPLGSDNPSAPEQSQLYSSDGVLPEGSRFGAYIVGACIGHGGMARIYRAEHEGLRRSVALKVLLDGFAQDPEGHERFLREGRIAAAIKHPNVVNIFDVGFQGSTPYLVMELLEGQDLEALMYAQGSMPESTLVDIIVPIVAGLAAVHDAGVIHRDLKPGNIFLARGRNEEIEPKLLDFGISKAAESEQFKLTTARGLLMGTPLYMSPEAIQGSEITALSDQYSLGVVLYECCTGFNPFAADTLAETVRRVTTGDFPPIAQQNGALSKRMARIIGRAMSLDPSHRFSSLREMGRELLFLAGQRTRITWSLSFGEVAAKRTGGMGSLSNAPRSTPPPARQYGKLSSAVAVAFGLVLFGSAVALLWSSRSTDSSEQSVSRALRGPTPAATAPGTVTPSAGNVSAANALAGNAPGASAPAAGSTPAANAAGSGAATTNGAAQPPGEAHRYPADPEPAGGLPDITLPATAALPAEPAAAAPKTAPKAPAAPARLAKAELPASPEAAPRRVEERMRAALGDEDEEARAAKRRARAANANGRRRPAPAPAPAPAPTARAEQRQDPPPPDWKVPAAQQPAPKPHQNTALGTNNAPIFE